MTQYQTIKLNTDDLLMGFKKGDEIIVDTRTPPASGSLVVAFHQGQYFLHRYEAIEGNAYLWPPREYGPGDYEKVLFGQAIELNRAL